ncbi:MAG: hypothetical protein AAGD38_05290 [Acidobacteriota bacterium]
MTHGFEKSSRIARRVALIALLAAAFVTGIAGAQGPTITVDPVECFPTESNNVVYANIAPALDGVRPQLFFRWNETEPFYYVFMESVGGGRYWATPPIPRSENNEAAFYVSLTDGTGQEISRTDMMMAPVQGGCEVELTPQQQGTALNLEVGETTWEQQGREVDGWECDGVVTRIDPNGVRRADEKCRVCIIAWWERPTVAIPAAAGAGVLTGVLLIDRGDEGRPSPSRP